MPCQSFILAPLDKTVGGYLQTTLCLPKEIILHRMFSCLPGGRWGDCLGTEWQLNSGKIKLTERQLQKGISEIEVLVRLTNVSEKATLSRMKANSFVFLV